MEGTIFNIQRFSTGDGPGIRTTVFFKGCPLKCKWCHNPESQIASPQIGYYQRKCLHCGKCAVICPQKAIVPSREKNQIHDNLCNVCGVCEAACPVRAIEVLGHSYSVEKVMKQVKSDIPFYGKYGGVTLSGGEPMLQHKFVLALLMELKKEKLHTALDTCGYCSWEALQEVLPYVDLILYDIKHMDSKKHQGMTGADNKIILENFKRIQQLGIKTRVRVPVIPDFNDAYEDFEQLAVFLKPYPSVQVELLGYHVYGISKYEAIGRTYELSNYKQPQNKEIKQYQEWLEQMGVAVLT